VAQGLVENNPNTYEQIELSGEILGWAGQFL